jgi:hypothetical protein
MANNSHSYIDSDFCLLKCHAVCAVLGKPTAIRFPRSGTPPVRPEGFGASGPFLAGSGDGILEIEQG